MSDDDVVAKELAELIPQMQRAAEVALADAKGRERKQRSRVIDALMSEVGAYVRGRRNDPCFGIGEQVSDLTSTGRALSSTQVAAFSALAAYAYALEAAWDHGAGRATAEKVTEQLEAARKHAREIDAPRAPAPNPADVRARVLRLVPGDDRELAALTAVIVEHRLVDLVPAVLDRLGLVDDTDTIDHAVRAMSRLFRPASKFTDVCAGLCASPNVGTRRWVARAMIHGLRPEHVEPLLPLLADDEPKVRREAATVLRAAAIWHPEKRPAIERATEAAWSRFGADPALAELRASLSAPPPTTQ